jgi:hypothetical protein
VVLSLEDTSPQPFTKSSHLGPRLNRHQFAVQIIEFDPGYPFFSSGFSVPDRSRQLCLDQNDLVIQGGFQLMQARRISG